MDACYAPATDTLTLEGNAGLPCFAAPLTKPAYVHQVPGRLRIELRHLKKNPTAIEGAREWLGTVAGIRSVRGNPVLGSLTIEHDPGMKPETLLSVLRAHEATLSKDAQAAAAGCTCGRLSEGTSPWKNVAFAGMAVHLVFDLIVWSTAARTLASR